MSAYVVAPEHIRELVAFAVSKGSCGSMRVDPRYLKYHVSEELAAQFSETMTDDEIATVYAGVLYSENLRSVQERYPDCEGINDLPGLIEKPEFIVISMGDIVDRKVKNMLDILKMCDCLEYQSCETDNYRQTDAHQLTQKIKEAAVRNLPGYDDATWEYRGGGEPPRRRRTK